MKPLIKKLGIAAGAFVALLLIFWFFVVDILVEHAIEKAGSSLVGAKVELASADLSLFPAGLDLEGAQVTNPRNYMSNAVEFQRAEMTLDFWQLLKGNYWIEEASIDGMQVNTPRQSPGDIPRSGKAGVMIKEYAEKKAQELQIPSFDKPVDVNDILGKEDLQTFKLIGEVQEDIARERTAWEKRIAELPTKKTFEGYKSRIEEIQKTAKKGVAGALGAVAEADKVRKEMLRDLGLVKTAKDELEKTLDLLQRRVKETINAPQRDVERLMDKYGVSSKGLTNLTRLLVGSKAADLVGSVLYWHQRITPFLEGRDAEDIEEKQEAAPQKPRTVPKFWLKQARIGFLHEVGEFGGKIENATSDQPLVGKPLIASFTGKKLKMLQSASLEASFNHIKPASSEDSLKIAAKGYDIKELALSKSERWPVQLKHALGDVSATGAIRGPNLDLSLRAALRSVDLATDFKEKSAIATAVAGVLKDVNNFELKAHIQGTVDSYAIDLTSNLDTLLQQAVAKLIAAQMAELQKKLTAEIQKKVDGPLKELQGKMGGFGGLTNDLTARLQAGGASGTNPTGAKPKLKIPFLGK